MPIFADIRGQDRALATLRAALQGNRVHHAYLLCGPQGCGKYTTGLALASALNCLQNPGEGCHECAACTRIDEGIHPDIITLEREGAAQIVSIETVRNRVLRIIGHSPHEGRARVILVEEAGSMLGPSANALLKTLEEPPPNTHFVLGTTAPDQLLPTIRSRCQRINFAALPPDLRAEVAEEDERAARLTGHIEQLLAALADGGSSAMRDAAAAATSERTEVAPVLELLAHRLHQQARQAVHAEELERAAGLAQRATAVLHTERVITAHNAHGQLAFDSLLRRLREIPV